MWLEAGTWANWTIFHHLCWHILLANLFQNSKQTIAGHPGHFKTLEHVSRNYWWPNMSHYIRCYVATCNLCLWTKIQHWLPIRELVLIPIPTECWDTIHINFVVKLLDLEGHDTAMTVVDTAGKRGHFIETTTTVTAAGVARIFLWNIWKLHRLPQKVISN